MLKKIGNLCFNPLCMCAYVCLCVTMCRVMQYVLLFFCVIREKMMKLEKPLKVWSRLCRSFISIQHWVYDIFLMWYQYNTKRTVSLCVLSSVPPHVRHTQLAVCVAFSTSSLPRSRQVEIHTVICQTVKPSPTAPRRAHSQVWLHQRIRNLLCSNNKNNILTANSLTTLWRKLTDLPDYPSN